MNQATKSSAQKTLRPINTHVERRHRATSMLGLKRTDGCCEWLWQHHRTVGLLISLEKCCDRARKAQARAIERVQDLGLVGWRRAPADVHTPCLKVAKVGHR